MGLKTIEMVRNIRDQQYEETKDFTVVEQIKFVREKSKKLKNHLKKHERLVINGRVKTNSNSI